MKFLFMNKINAAAISLSFKLFTNNVTHCSIIIYKFNENMFLRFEILLASFICKKKEREIRSIKLASTKTEIWDKFLAVHVGIPPTQSTDTSKDGCLFFAFTFLISDLVVVYGW